MTKRELNERNNRIVIMSIMGVVFLILFGILALLIYNKFKVEKVEDMPEQTVIVNTPAPVADNTDNPNDNTDVIVPDLIVKDSWDFEIDDPVIDDFLNARWGYHLPEFQEYNLDDAGMPTFIIAYRNINASTSSHVIKVIEEFTDKKHSLFPINCSYPVDVVLTDEEFRKFTEQVAYDELEYYDVDTYRFVILRSAESNLTLTNGYDNYAYTYGGIAFLGVMENAKVLNYGETIGYPTNWILSDVDSHYRDAAVFNASANGKPAINIQSEFFKYFNLMEHLTLDDGTVVEVKNVNYFVSASHNSSNYWRMSDLAESNEKIGGAYRALRNNNDVLLDQYVPGDSISGEDYSPNINEN